MYSILDIFSLSLFSVVFVTKEYCVCLKLLHFLNAFISLPESSFWDKKKQQLKQANNVGYVFHYWIAFLFIYAIVVLDYTNSPTKV